MNKELLKRVIAECSDEGSHSNISTDLYCAITEYLEMPEPEPVASINGWYGGYPTICIINGTVLPVGMALYPYAPARLPLQTPHTTQIDQSAQISELIAQRTLQESIIKSAYTSCRELEERLATLQAKREPLSDEEVNRIAMKVNPWSGYRFARAIEAAHGIKGE